MDEIEEIQQLTQLSDVEQDTGIAEVTNDLCSSDEKNDGDKDSKEDTRYMLSWKNDYYTMTHYLLLNFDSGTKLTQVTNIIVK